LQPGWRARPRSWRLRWKPTRVQRLPTPMPRSLYNLSRPATLSLFPPQFPISELKSPIPNLRSSIPNHRGFMDRRIFLSTTGMLGGSALSSLPLPRLLAQGANQPELSADVVIIGGGLGGCAAALAALRNGLRVVMTEPTDWIGGQLTS